MCQVKAVDVKVVRDKDGTLMLMPASLEAAQKLIGTYVPEADVLTFWEAFDLAMIRDERAAAGLEMDAVAIIDSEVDVAMANAEAV